MDQKKRVFWSTPDSVSFGQKWPKIQIRKNDEMPFKPNAGLGFVCFQRKCIYGNLMAFRFLWTLFCHQNPVLSSLGLVHHTFLFSFIFSFRITSGKISARMEPRARCGHSKVLEPQGFTTAGMLADVINWAHA